MKAEFDNLSRSSVNTRRVGELANISHEVDVTDHDNLLTHARCRVTNTNNPSELTTLSSVLNKSDHDSSITTGHIAVTIASADKYPAPSFPAEFSNYPGILYLIYAASLLYMFPSLIALVELKFQNKAHSAFETHSLFTNMAVVAYIIAIPTSVTLFCLKARLDGLDDRETLSQVYYKILQSVFYFSSILAPLSFVVVLFFPHGFDWIGYSIISTLFVIIFGCCFGNFIKLLCKKDASNLKALQGNETSSQSALDNSSTLLHSVA